MNSVPYSICFATIVLWATMSIPVLAQEPVGGSQGIPQGIMERTTSRQRLNLHKVTLETKIKWGTQLLFYPKALKFIIALHAYKLDDICDHQGDLAKQDLGFAIASIRQENDLNVVGYSLIESRNHRPPTLAEVCLSLRRPPYEKKGLPDPSTIHPPDPSTIHELWKGEEWNIHGLRDKKTRTHLLVPFSIENNIPHDLYWTPNLSNEIYYQRMRKRTTTPVVRDHNTGAPLR